VCLFRPPRSSGPSSLLRQVSERHSNTTKGALNGKERSITIRKKTQKQAFVWGAVANLTVLCNARWPAQGIDSGFGNANAHSQRPTMLIYLPPELSELVKGCNSIHCGCAIGAHLIRAGKAMGKGLR
jgi:hypothetical protein